MTASFIRCAICDRLNIYGATCTCGHRTDQPTTHQPEPRATEADEESADA